MTTKAYTYASYIQMWDALLAFKAKNGRLPNYIDWGGLRITHAAYEDAFKRVVAYRLNHGGANPGTVGMSGTDINTPPQPAPSGKSAFHLLVEQSVGSYNTFTDYYNRIKAKSWKGYENDIYNQVQELQRLKGNLPLNCSDHSQLGYAVAKDLGYNVRFEHIKCKVSGGHVILNVSGHELGSSYISADLAYAANSNGPLGRHWCENGTTISYNDPWLMSDDGHT